MKKWFCLLLALLLCCGVALGENSRPWLEDYRDPWLGRELSGMCDTYGEPLWSDGNVHAWKTGEYMLYAVFGQDGLRDYLKLTEDGRYIWAEFSDALTQEEARTLLVRSGYARGDLDDPWLGMHVADIRAAYGEAVWGGAWMGTWQTDEGTLIIACFRDRVVDYLHLTSDRTVISSTIGPDMTRKAVRELLLENINATNDPHVHALGSGRVIPASFTWDGYILVCYDEWEWEIYDCVRQRYAPLWMNLLLVLGL